MNKEDTGPITTPGHEKTLTGEPEFIIASMSGLITIQGRFYHVIYRKDRIPITDGLGNPADPNCKIWEMAEQFNPWGSTGG